MRHPITVTETIVAEIDSLLQTLLPVRPRPSSRRYPGESCLEDKITLQQKQAAGRLMRVNHAGEVAAQALYRGQALTARENTISQQMKQSAQEETDHLAWCEQRLAELNTNPSQLNVIWYLGSFFIGSIAGLVGDHWSLGFVVETEKQVAEHLAKHIEQIPLEDQKTLTVLKQMQQDEQAHGLLAEHLGARALPSLVKNLMSQVSKIMTSISYYG